MGLVEMFLVLFPYFFIFLTPKIKREELVTKLRKDIIFHFFIIKIPKYFFSTSLLHLKIHKKQKKILGTLLLNVKLSIKKFFLVKYKSPKLSS